MSEIKRITIPVQADLKNKLELIAKNQKRSMSANLEHALEVYAALFNDEGKMLVPIDSILMGDLSCLTNVTKTVSVKIKNEQNNDNQSENKTDEAKTDESIVKTEEVKEQTNTDFGAFAPQ